MMTAPTFETPSDKELLSRHVRGEAEAFGELVRRHRERLWAVALRTLGDEEEAADALQEALISAFRKAGSFRGDAAVTTWLHRIVVNSCLDRVRRQAARPAIPFSDALETMATETTDPARQRDDARDVTAALWQLPVEQRVSLVLVDMEGYSVEETARLLDVAAGTVKSRCARGRARLAPLLADLHEDGSRNRERSDRVSSWQDREKGGESGS